LNAKVVDVLSARGIETPTSVQAKGLCAGGRRPRFSRDRLRATHREWAETLLGAASQRGSGSFCGRHEVCRGAAGLGGDRLGSILSGRS
jgi:hypothetical protein